MRDSGGLIPVCLAGRVSQKESEKFLLDLHTDPVERSKNKILMPKEAVTVTSVWVKIVNTYLYK